MSSSPDARAAFASLLLALASSAAWAACTGVSDDDDGGANGSASGGSGGGGSAATGGTGGGAVGGTSGTSGAAAGSNGGGGDDPLNAAPVCTSGDSVSPCDGGDDDRLGSPALDEAGCELGENMNPGRACVSCHDQTSEDAPPLWFGGTVYPTGHEPELCRGGPTGRAATVIITDANDAEFRRTVNASGNFLLERAEVANLAFPIRAKVVYQGRERVMATPQMIGDCNSCHSQDGDNGAPGRITLP